MSVLLTLKQLLTPVTQEQALASWLGTLSTFGFAATSWQPGSKQRTIVETGAKLYSDLTYTVADITNSGFALLAKGAYADQLGTYSFNLIRIPATQTIGTMVLTSSPGAPVHNWVDGQLLISDQPPGTLNANVFRVSGGGTLPSNSSTTITVKGDIPGAAANIPPGVTLYMWTPLAGVTASNPALSGTNSWITTPGTDKESDERYGLRMIGRWSALTYGNTDGAYVYWALTALPALTRVSILRNPLLPGQITVVGATAVGGLTAPQITTITDYINGTADGVGRRPINDVLLVSSATVNLLPALNITVVVSSQYAGDAATRISTALTTLFGAISIGGQKLPGSNQGFALIASMYQTIMAQTGVINVTGLPATDVTLATLDVYTPTITVTVVSV